MANEITFGFLTGKTLTYGAYEPDGSVRTAAATALPEIGATGYYTATNGSIVAGDIVIVKEGTLTVGWGEYRPEVNCVLIEGADFTDTLIGADGDTHEDLSDQLDAILIESNKIHNVYGSGE